MNLRVVVVAVLMSLTSGSQIAGGARVLPGDPVVYIGAVLEYETYREWTEEGGEGITRENARIISEYAALAKIQGADLLVAPEYGVQSLEMHSTNPQELFSVMQYAPDPELKSVPCEMSGDLGNVEAVRTLSCSARFNQMYLVVDLGEASPCTPDTATNNPFENKLDTSYECPASGYIYYNTQLVFDRNGTVIARYRKKNLYLEPQFHPGTEPDDTAVFTTDFGVTFTLQVCFDIVFVHPGFSNVKTKNISDVVMSTAWVDILPFSIAPAVQNGWSRGLQVNLLVSGHHWPERSKMGSGIYRGASDLKHTYVYDTESGSQLVVSEVETVASVEGTQPNNLLRMGIRNLRGRLKEAPRRDHLIVYDDLSNFTQVVLLREDESGGGVQYAEACHNDGLCCTLTYTPSSGNLTYSLLAYSGIMVEGDTYKLYNQICAITWCDTAVDINTCGHVNGAASQPGQFGPFTISGNFNADFVFPVMISRDLNLIDNDHFSYVSTGKNFTMSTQEATDNILSVGHYGRWYERDP